MTDLAAELDRILSDRYSIERPLGRGGMATVYLARDLRHHRRVALKLLHPELASLVGPERFLREIDLTADLNHPHILPLFDSGSIDLRGTALPFYVMPYVEGETLRERLTREGALPLEEALQIGREAADALGYAHSRGIVHRDIKPENILLAQGHAVVADFGIARAFDAASVGETARLTETGVAIGTAAYMSPEQATGSRDIDARSDIYSLGCVVYEMVTGETPFTGPSVQAIIAKRMLTSAPSVRTVRDTVPPSVDLAIQKALARIPGDRFFTAQQFRDALTPGALAPTASLPGQRVPRRWGWAAAGVVILAIITGLLIVAARPEPPAGVAILPFRNISDEPESQYFADGMTEEMTSALSKIEGLRVIGGSSVAGFAGRDVAEVGRELAVGSVLDGSVRRNQDQVRITIRLIDVRTRENRWSQEYDRRLRDVFSIQSDIAHQVTRALEVELTPGEQIRVQRAPTGNLEAYDLYLRGLHLVTGGGTRTSTDSAILIFQKAIDLDPSFALAHAALARVYVRKLFSFDADPRWEEQAFIEITKALNIDTTLAEAYLARGELAWTKANGFRAAEAIQDFRRALRYKPNLREAHASLGRVYAHVGQLEHALVELRAAAALDPMDRFATSRIGQVHFFQHKYDTALVELEGMSGWEEFRALAFRRLGRTREGWQVLDSLMQSVPASQDSSALAATMAIFLASEQRFEEAERSIQVAIQNGKELSHFHHAEYYIGVAYALMNNTRAARQWLEASARDGFPCYPVFATDEDLVELRKDPDFARWLVDLRTRWERFRDIAGPLPAQ